MKIKRIIAMYMVFIMVLAGPAYSFAASNGTNWSNQTSDTTQMLIDVTYNEGVFVAVGLSGTVRTSTNGTSWDSQTSNTTAILCSITYGNGVFLAMAVNNTVLTSVNGISWEVKNSNTSTPLCPVTYGAGIFVGVGESAIQTSLDGVDWISVDSNTDEVISDVIYKNSKYIAVGHGGTILVANDPNAANWMDHTEAGANLNGINFGNGIYVAVGDSGRILTSMDGVNWESQVSGVTEALLDIIYENDQFVAVGALGRILTSSDAVNWVSSTSNTTNTLLNVAYGNGAYVAVGMLGSITASTPSPTPVVTASPTPVPTPIATTGPVVPISLDAAKYTLNIGATHTTVVYLNNLDNSSSVIAASEVVFASSSALIATVDSNGIVTGISKGTATISSSYVSGGTTLMRNATVTVDSKAPAYLESNDKKTGAVSLSNILDADGSPLQGAAVKISQGTKVWSLVNTDSDGNVLAYVPAGKYNVLVYSKNGTMTKNYAFKSLSVIAGQRSEPMTRPQLAAGSLSLSVHAVNGADKKITGEAPMGSTVMARYGTVTIGTATADKQGKFSIALKVAQPNRTIGITASDVDENEKSIDVEVPRVTAVTLIAATKSNDVDHDTVITFKDPVGQLVNSVTSVTYNENELVVGTDYTLAAGKLTIKAGVIQAIGSHAIVVKSSSYEDAAITQEIKAGVADATNSSYTLNGTLTEGQSVIVTVVIKDKYGNLNAGKQVYADITVTNTIKTKAEKYTIGSGSYGAIVKKAKVGSVTSSNGETTITIAIPAAVDVGDGISIQLKAGAAAVTATHIGEPIVFTK